MDGVLIPSCLGGFCTHGAIAHSTIENKYELLVKSFITAWPVSQQPPGNLGEAGSLTFRSTDYNAQRPPRQFSAIIIELTEYGMQLTPDYCYFSAGTRKPSQGFVQR